MGLTKFTPLALAVASASLVRREIASRSCSASGSVIQRSLASGMSQARKRTSMDSAANCRIEPKPTAAGVRACSKERHNTRGQKLASIGRTEPIPELLKSDPLCSFLM